MDDSSTHQHQHLAPQPQHTLAVQRSETLIQKQSTHIQSFSAEYVRDCNGSYILDEDQKPLTVHRMLATQPLRCELSTRPGPGNRQLTYMSGDAVTRTLNEIFGFDGWSLDVKNTNREECIQDDKKRYHVAYTATVRVTHNRSGVYKEDCGAGDAIDKSLGTAVANALKASVTDAMKRASRHFGDKLGNSLYQKSFSVNKAPHTVKQALEFLNKEQTKFKGLTMGLPPSTSGSVKALPSSENSNVNVTRVLPQIEMLPLSSSNNTTNMQLGNNIVSTSENVNSAENKNKITTNTSPLPNNVQIATNEPLSSRNEKESNLNPQCVQASHPNNPSAMDLNKKSANTPNSYNINKSSYIANEPKQRPQTPVVHSHYGNNHNQISNVPARSTAPNVPIASSSTINTMSGILPNIPLQSHQPMPPPLTSQQKLQSIGIARFSKRNDNNENDVPVLGDITNITFDYDDERPSTSYGKRLSVGSDFTGVKKARNPYN